MNSFYVYEHTRNDTNQVFYVGKGKANRAFHFLNRNRHWQSVSKKSGGVSVGFLVKNVDEELAFLVEMERIDQLRRIGVRLTNMTDGGEGISGFEFSNESKKKMSLAMIGKNKGKPSKFKGLPATTLMTDEIKKKISKTKTGRTMSEETRKKIALAMVGKNKGKPSPRKGLQLSDSHRKAISSSKVGKQSNRIGCYHTEETRKKMSESHKSRNAIKGQQNGL